MDASQIFEELGKPRHLPVEAIRAAQADRDSMVPLFLRSIDEFLAPAGTPIAPSALFFVFHLLGEWREKSAYRPLAKFLRSPGDALAPILGDAKTETTHRVMAAVFDGDPNPLYEIVRDKDADEFIRSRMCQTIAMLTRRGELPRAKTAQFLRDCYSQLEPQVDCYVWQGWVDAVAWLGFDDLKPLVQQAFARGSIDPMWLTFKNFEQDLQHALEHPDAEPFHPDGNLTLFGDTIAELSNWHCFTEKTQTHGKAGRALPRSPYIPERHLFPKVGRNDPCPCGSGKKFKKCCLTVDLHTVSVGDPS